MNPRFLVLLASFVAANHAAAQAPNHRYEPGIIWQQLRDMESPAIRSASASLGGRLYLLGGLNHSNRGRSSPSNELRELDVRTGRWETLAPCPTATWGAVMLADPEDNRLLVFGGTEGGGVPGAKDTLKVAVYNIANGDWQAFEINHNGIGKPTLAFEHNDMVAMLTENPAELVMVDVEKRKVVTTTPCPEGFTLSDGVLIGDTVFICGNENHELWRCELGQPNWKKVGVLSASRARYGSVLFTDGHHLLSWSPRESGARTDTAVWEINPDTGGETIIHRAIPGPLARGASSNCVGDGKLYVCGGQGSKGGWLQDIWIYDIAAGQQLRDLNKRPDPKLDWAIEALADHRITERWVWEVLSKRRPSVIIDRLSELPDGPRRHIRWRLLCTLMGDVEADIAFLHAVPTEQLLKEVADIWPLEIEPVARNGAYHWTIRARSIVGPVVHDAVILSIEGHDTDRAKLVHFETVRERVYLFEQAPPWLGTCNCGVLNRGRIMYSADTGRGGTGDSRGFGHAIPRGMTLPTINLQDPGEFAQNAAMMPIEVQRLIPAGY